LLPRSHDTALSAAASLGGADPGTRDDFAADVRAALQTADSAVIAKTRRARVYVFQDWNEFCVFHNQNPSLCDVVDDEARLCFLLVFGLRRRQSRTGPTGQPIRAGTVASALLAVGQGIANLGQPAPRLQASGKPHALLSSFLSALTDEDDPATRAYPANLAIVRRVSDVLDFGHAKHGLIINAGVADKNIISVSGNQGHTASLLHDNGWMFKQLLTINQS